MKYSKTTLMELSHKYSSILRKCALFNAAILMGAMVALPVNAGTIDSRVQITENKTYTDLTAENIASTVANNGGVFYLEDVQNATLTFNGSTLFKNNSLSGPSSGMGGAIGNGWLSSKDTEKWNPYTPGGKIVFNGATTFEGNTVTNINGGGAIFTHGVGTVESPDIIFNNTVTFEKNKATGSSGSVYPAGGGAIHQRGGTVVFNNVATFSENESASKGAGIITSGTMIFKENANFSKNIATSSGGALAILGGDVTFEKKSSFSENAAGTGSAISIDQSNSKLTFKDVATFTKNTGTATLWNNSSTGEVYFENGAEFDQNTNTLNGTLQNAGAVSVTGGDFKFRNNTGSNGGGLKNAGTVTVDTTGDVLFDTNTTTSSAGAFDNGGTASITANQIAFNNNTANAGYGGAIFNAGHLSLLGQENLFTNNTAKNTSTTKAGGGAIHNRGITGTATLVIGNSNSQNTFSNNNSFAHGAAIVARAFDGEGQDSDVTINGTTTFNNNSASASGGAIWNCVAEKSGTTGKATFVFNGDTTFKENTAGSLGGAIYNNDSMTFNGATVFSGNTDSSGANDIYNAGIINFNGDVTLDGGVVNTDAGVLNFKKDTTVTLADVLSGSTIISGGTIAANGATLDSTSFVVSKADTYTFADSTFDSDFGLSDNLQTAIDNNLLYDITYSEGKFTVEEKEASDIAEDVIAGGATAQEAQTIAAVAEADSTHPVVDAIKEALQTGNVAAVAKAAEDLAPTTSQQVMGIAQSVNTLLNNVTGTRMAALGKAGGDAFIGGSTWVQGLYNHSKQDASGNNAGFSANTKGIAFGIDGKVNEAVTIGLGYGYTKTDADSRGRDVDVDGHNFFIYGQYQPDAWYVNTMLSYGLNKYEEKKSPMGTAMKAKYDVNTFAANVMTGYDFDNGITPEGGFRYVLADQDSYNDGAQRVSTDKNDVLTAVMGVKYSTNVKAEDWTFKPTLRLAATYDVVSDNSKANVNVTGGSNYQITGDRLHRFGVETGVGVTSSVKDWDLTLEYNGGFRKDFQSHTGMLKATYHF